MTDINIKYCSKCGEDICSCKPTLHENLSEIPYIYPIKCKHVWTITQWTEWEQKPTRLEIYGGTRASERQCFKCNAIEVWDWSEQKWKKVK